MNKHDVECAKIRAKSKKFSEIVSIVIWGTTAIIILGIVSMTMNGLTDIAGIASEGKIRALAVMIEKIEISKIIYFLILPFLTITTIGLQRLRNKRAIREKNKYQKIAEKNDPSRSSSDS